MKTHAYALVAGGIAALAGTLVGGCGSGPAAAPTPTPNARVYILGREALRPPTIGEPIAYAPETWTPATDGGPATARFHLAVLTDRPDELKLRLSAATIEPAKLVRRTTNETVIVGDVPLADAAEEPDACADTGCYWLDPRTGADATHRVTVIVPETRLAANPWLEAYVSETASGSPLLADRVQLAREFFYLAAIGDSVMWGNGIRENDKFTSLVARQIELETGRKVIPIVKAVSGATIVPFDDSGICAEPCLGEVPTGFTPITVQATQLLQPELLDLILLDGCANDVGLSAILSPKTDPAELETMTRTSCEQDMIGLLEQVRALAPQAPIVVTGYFPFVSDESLELGAEELAIVQGLARADLEEIDDPTAAMAENSRVFHEVSSLSLAAAVAAVIASDENASVAFADPGYGPQNAVFASESWLWNLSANDNLANILGFDMRLFPEDPILDLRMDACNDPDVAPDLLSCIYGSLAHPNPAGAEAYAEQIVAALRSLGTLPATSDEQNAP